MAAKIDMADFIPVERYYANLKKMRNTMLMVVAVVALLTFFGGYFAGFRNGDVDAKLEQATHANKTQTKVFANDRKVLATRPDHRDIDAWAKWMRKQQPFLSR